LPAAFLLVSPIPGWNELLNWDQLHGFIYLFI